LVHYANWKAYNLWAYTLKRGGGAPVKRAASKGWSSRRDGYYIKEQHGKTNECYDLETAKFKCERAPDCHGIATQSNVCGGKYRVTHGAKATLVHYANWKPYNLWAYTLKRGGSGSGEFFEEEELETDGISDWLKFVSADEIKKAIAAAKKAGAKEGDEVKFLPKAVVTAAKAKAEEAELDDAVAENLDVDARGCTRAYAGRNWWGHRGCCGIFQNGASCGTCSHGYKAHNHNGNCGLEGSYTCCPP